MVQSVVTQDNHTIIIHFQYNSKAYNVMTYTKSLTRARARSYVLFTCKHLLTLTLHPTVTDSINL